MRRAGMTYYSRSENRFGEKELLKVHLKKTAALARQFAESFGEGDCGELLGLFHDAGKASERFQGVLKGCEHGINHEACGAFFLWQSNHKLLARVVYAHHKGIVRDIEGRLSDSYKTESSKDKTGRRFAVSGAEEYKNALDFLKNEVGIPNFRIEMIKENNSFYKNLPRMLHARMLLSCLADADYSASATHNDEEYLEKSTDEKLYPQLIFENLEKYRLEIIKNSNSDAELNNIRDSVYRDCISAAEKESGVFTLTAPTGTGKTLALLGFAAKHAAKYKKERIIFVLPFLSIIDQNAKIYREICGNVLESHSMSSYDEQTKLFAERWTSPVIVTTSVKFFEALFKSMPADIRFLHSIANSVIVFDEAQSLPAELIGTSMETLNSLCEMFRCTVVLSTATQPAFDLRRDINYAPKEIISDPRLLYDKTRRVNVEWNISEPMELETVAEEMSHEHSVCCVVNRKDHSHKLFSLLKERADDCFYISTDMCKAHRARVIEEIIRRQKNGLSCRLVSTSCIEAGVDLDFDVMYRALAPFDSIIQCAGRCNRNGKTSGKMTVFIPNEEKLYPSPFYGNAANCVRIISARHSIDINNPEHIREYYAELFKNCSEDKKELVNAVDNFDFEETAKRYKLIGKTGVNVLVPFEGECGLFDELYKEATERGITKSWMRRAAPITVTSYNVEKLSELCERPVALVTSRGKFETRDWFILSAEKFYTNDEGLVFDNDSSLDFII